MSAVFSAADLRRQAREHQRELVAGQAADDEPGPAARIRRARLGERRRDEVAERMLQALSDLDQDAVAHLLPQRIVEALEAIHVDQQHGRAVPRRARLAQRLLARLQEAGAAGDAGEEVAMRLLAHRAHALLRHRRHVLDPIELQRGCRPAPPAPWRRWRDEAAAPTAASIAAT